MHKLIFFICLSTICLHLSAQSGWNSKLVEDSTYALYLAGNWKALQWVGTQALHHHVDYYYLRLRLGVACFERQHYRLALRHLEHAQQLNSADELMQQYLYYSYVYSGRYNEGERLTAHFSEEVKSATHSSKPSPINYLNAEGGLKLADHPTVVGPLYYGSFAFNHLLTRGYSLFHSYEYVWQRFDYGTYQQHQYYVTANIPLRRGFSFFPAFSVLYDVFRSSTAAEEQRVHFLGALNFSKDFAYVKVQLANSFSTLDSAYQLQHSVAVTIYPLANQRLSLGGTFILFTPDFYRSTRGLFQATMGFNFPTYFSLDMSYTHAHVRNFNLYNGYLVQNGYDRLNENVTIVPAFIIKQRYRIYAMYQLEFKTEQTRQVNYISQGISLGTKIIL